MSAGPDGSSADVPPAVPPAPSVDVCSNSGDVTRGAFPAIPAVQAPDGKPADMRSALLKSGWFQGAVLPPEMATQVRMLPGADAPPAPACWPAGPWCVVVSQDCDLVYGDCVADPVAEIILATPIEQPSAKCERLRNPRELHIQLTKADGSSLPVAIDVRNRGTLDRVLLLTAAPATELFADSVAMRWIASHIARRYMRTARPEAFDWRFRKARKKIIELVDAEDAVLLDVMLGIQPRGEIGSDKRYAVSIHPILQDEFGDLPRSAQQKKRNIISEAIRQAMLPCKEEGIDVEIIEIKTRYDISLREYDDLLPMDLGPP
jgi:hypothetical protein